MYEFLDGTRMRFGRDDGICEIPVWRHIETRAATLSRIAGELYCDDGTMWVRNLSESHELRVAGTGEPGHVLGRRQSPWPAPGRSLPYPRATVSVPSSGEWLISVEAVRPASPRGPGGSPEALAGLSTGALAVPPTTTFPPLPARWHAAARALCLPLLSGAGTVPSTYTEVAEATGWTRRQARRAVDDLCDYYEDALGKGFDGWRRQRETRAAALARLLVDRGVLTSTAGPSEDERG